jgi:hypothetical protein
MIRRAGTAPAVRHADSGLPASPAGRVHWGSLHDAWQGATAVRVGAAHPGKEPLPVGVLIAIAEHRVRAMLVLRDALGQASGFRRRIDALQAQVRDSQGRNWNILAGGAGGSLARASDEAAFRVIVDALRDQFDLA